MVFSSMVFLWIFLPVVFVLGMLIRKPKYQNIVLLIASLLFYAWGEPRYIFLLLFSVLMNWVLGLLMDRYRDRKKLFLILALVGNLSLLGYFKYCNFFLNTLDHLLPFVNVPRTSIALPIGISFFTFQAMSYIIDLYRGEYKVQKNLFDLMLYISFFPQLIAGPIVKYRDIDEQIGNRTITRQKVAEGFRRFVYGLGKKVILSNLLAVSVDKIFALDLSVMGTGTAWIGAVFYTLQIYYDFSVYSDMAIGLGRMFGFDFLENFNYPYLSSSIHEFWRRWHISLSTWFKEYLYIPLGGNRKGTRRTYINLIIVFAVTGLWHGASWNFVFWGLYHGFFQIIERLGFGRVLKKDRTKILSRLYTILVVTIGWVFFNAPSFTYGLGMVGRMLLPFLYAGQGTNPALLVSTKTLLAFAAALLGCGMIQSIFTGRDIGTAAAADGQARERVLSKLGAKWKNSAAEAVFLAVVLMYCILLLSNNTYNPFIYFRF